MMVPQLGLDGEFQMIEIKQGTVYTVIQNDPGPVYITLATIIVPKRFAIEN